METGDGLYPLFWPVNIGAKTIKMELRGYSNNDFEVCYNGNDYYDLKEEDDSDSVNSFSSSEADDNRICFQDEIG